jgi:hypothetical protein
MHAKPKPLFVAAILIALILAVFIFWANVGRSEAAAPGPGYFTGAMRNKSNPNLWVTADGKIVPPPPGATLVSTPTHRKD